MEFLVRNIVAAQAVAGRRHACLCDAVMDREARGNSRARSRTRRAREQRRVQERPADADSAADDSMVKELLTYFGYVAAKQRLYDRFANDPTAKRMMKMADAVESEGRGRGRRHGISSRRRRPEPNNSVISSMRQLVREGYLASGDFGWSVPDEVKPYLAGVEKEKEGC